MAALPCRLAAGWAWRKRCSCPLGSCRRRGSRGPVRRGRQSATPDACRGACPLGTGLLGDQAGDVAAGDDPDAARASIRGAASDPGRARAGHGRAWRSPASQRPSVQSSSTTRVRLGCWVIRRQRDPAGGVDQARSKRSMQWWPPTETMSAGQGSRGRAGAGAGGDAELALRGAGPEAVARPGRVDPHLGARVEPALGCRTNAPSRPPAPWAHRPRSCPPRPGRRGGPACRLGARQEPAHRSAVEAVGAAVVQGPARGAQLAASSCQPSRRPPRSRSSAPPPGGPRA